MPVQEECIEFINDSGECLRGILHYANRECPKSVSIVCLNTGLNDMVGWHRIQVKISRFLSENGYNVLRFDDTGIGDSDGEIFKESVVDIFSDIESGLFTRNADAALEFMQKAFPAEKLVYLGFCGGGLTAIHSASRNKRVDAIVDIGGPVTLSSKEYLQKTDPWEVQKNVSKYRSKLFQIRPWINFFTFRGEYQVIGTTLVNYIKHKIRGEYKPQADTEQVKDNANLNRKFFSAFEIYAASRRPMLFYYAEHDSATWEFKKYFLSKYQKSPQWSDRLFSFIEAKGANHIISDLESQDHLKQYLLKWLRSYF